MQSKRRFDVIDGRTETTINNFAYTYARSDMNTTLLVLAGGFGRRFGGFKQIEPITPGGRVIVDFSVYDAVQAGFDNVVFVVGKEFS